MKKIAVFAVLALMTLSFIQPVMAAENPASHMKMMRSKGVEGHFSAAIRDLGKDNVSASKEISEAAEVLNGKAAKATGDQQKALTDSSVELAALAAQVQAGTVTNPAQLQTVFAKARTAEKTKSVKAA